MPRRDGQDDCKVFVGSLPFSCTEDQLYNHFSWFGGVTDTKVVVDKESGRSRGFGFVTFDSQATAQAAVAQMNNTAIDGRPVFLELARESNQGGPRDRQGPPPGSFPSSGPPDSKRKWRVSIRGIHPGANWRDVKDYLRGVGDIAYATEKKDGSGDWIGDFLTEADRDAAVRRLDGRVWQGQKLQVTPEPHFLDQAQPLSSRGGGFGDPERFDQRAPQGFARGPPRQEGLRGPPRGRPPSPFYDEDPYGYAPRHGGAGQREPPLVEQRSRAPFAPPIARDRLSPRRPPMEADRFDGPPRARGPPPGGPPMGGQRMPPGRGPPPLSPRLGAPVEPPPGPYYEPPYMADAGGMQPPPMQGRRGAQEDFREQQRPPQPGGYGEPVRRGGDPYSPARGYAADPLPRDSQGPYSRPYDYEAGGPPMRRPDAPRLGERRYMQLRDEVPGIKRRRDAGYEPLPPPQRQALPRGDDGYRPRAAPPPDVFAGVPPPAAQQQPPGVPPPAARYYDDGHGYHGGARPPAGYMY